MAWTGNFKDQIDDLSGIITVTDNDAIQQWILDGCYDIINKVIKKDGEDEFFKFAQKSGAQTSNGIEITEIREVRAVERDGIFAKKVPFYLKNKYQDANSIYKAVDVGPIWYIEAEKLYIWPTPASGGDDNVYYYFLPEYSIAS